MDMEPDALEVLKIVRDNTRFVSPFEEPNGYYILLFEEDLHQGSEDRKEEIMRFYLEKLKYASKYADRIIQNAFQPECYEFYGVDHDVVKSPEDMCRQLVFDSFVLEPERGTIGACLSNHSFMYGHFIECCWDYDWNLLYWEIC